MAKFRLFKKCESYLKELLPTSGFIEKTRSFRLIDAGNMVHCGYNSEDEKFLEINQCPRIYEGMFFELKNLDTGKNDTIGTLVDIVYTDGFGYILVFDTNVDLIVE